MTGPKKPQPQKLSELSKDINLEFERWRSRRKIQKKQLRRVMSFFIWANLVAGILIATMAGIEHFTVTPHPIITPNVIIAYLSGITVQSGAAILAAFKGLFSEK
jgi:hypothetical protein